MAKLSVRLAPREREIVRLAALGDAPKQIAAELNISTRSVNNRIVGACRKAGVRRREQLIIWVLQHLESLDGVACEPGLHPAHCRCPEAYCVWMVIRAQGVDHPAGCRCSADMCLSLRDLAA